LPTLIWMSSDSVALARPHERRVLDPYERRIAIMAAHGSSNRAIGDSLGVSSRAVEHHLTKIYRKLGMAGRAELRQALRGPLR
jgi:DNA-binding CsgD family transcriptional regulator